MIEGERVYLRMMEMEDVPYKVHWVNDPEVRKSLLFPNFPVSKAATQNWLAKAALDPSRKDLMICLKSDDSAIGFAGLKGIDIKNWKAESYLCIGVKEYWGKGLGYEVKKLILDYGFNELGLNKIYSYHLADNAAMIRINLKLGGMREGVMREDVFSGGVFLDRVIVSVLKKDFYQTKYSGV